MFDLKKATEQSVSLQDAANKIMAGEDWKSKKIDWVTCSLAEIGEGVGWLGYKHWKKQEPNFHQAFIEIVDSYHFMLSKALESGVDGSALYVNAEPYMDINQRLANSFNAEAEIEKKKASGKMAFKGLALDCLEAERSSFPMNMVLADHLRAAAMIGLNAEAFFAGYIPKNCLNLFRQKNGDRDGLYPRIWTFEGQEIEDNQVVEIMVRLRPSLATDSAALTLALEEALANAKAVTGKNI